MEKGVDNWSEWRLAVARWAEDNPEAALQACQESFLFFCNAFLWTYKPLTSAGGLRRPTKGTKDRPFVTWPVQDRAATEIIDAIFTGKSAAIRKSRDMGATWLLLAIMVWILLFHPGESMMVVGRVAEDVDKDGDTDTLFSKIDYMLEMIELSAPWMVGPIERTVMHIKSTRTGSVIDGRATTSNVARGGRRLWIMVDEAAAIDKLEAIDVSTQDSTTCRIFNSTPRGGTYFGRLCRSGKVKLIVLPWWDHPEKGAAGRFTCLDKRTGKTIVDGPWRQLSILARLSARDIAENIDMDEEGSGACFFDMGTISRQTAMYGRFATYMGNLVLAHPPDTVLRWESWIVNRQYDRLLNRLGFESELVGVGKWLLWCELFQDSAGRWRPDQRYTYVLGIDPAGGAGAANAVISVFCKETGEKVGEFADNEISPHKLADVAAWAAVWFGGKDGEALIIWESNGVVGRQCTNRFRELAYRRLYKHVERTARTDKVTERLGFHKNTETGVDLLSAYRGALAADKFKNPCVEALEEAARYVYTETGGVDAGDNVGADGLARHTHGDRVIADALAWLGSLRVQYQKPVERVAPPGTVAHHLQQFLKDKRREDADVISYD